jgi:hypothetical protein
MAEVGRSWAEVADPAIVLDHTLELPCPTASIASPDQSWR